MSLFSNKSIGNTVPSPRRQSKTSSKARRRRYFLFSFLIYAFGFGLLYLIGEKLNENAYHPLAFLAPLFILIGMSAMVWSLVSPPKR